MNRYKSMAAISLVPQLPLRSIALVVVVVAQVNPTRFLYFLPKFILTIPNLEVFLNVVWKFSREVDKVCMDPRPNIPQFLNLKIP